jgi:hypothetical protein
MRLRLAEIVGLDVGDVFALDGTPRLRMRVRAAIAKGGRTAAAASRSAASSSRGRRGSSGRGSTGCAGSIASDIPRSRRCTG